MAAKQIILKDQKTGKEYTLEFNRKSIESMERQGFVAADISKKPMTMLPALFAGAFQMHHRFVENSVIKDLLYQIKNKDAFNEKLSEMFNEPLIDLVDEPEEDEGNIEWEASW